jgi:SAM-dependent methyltransferase
VTTEVTAEYEALWRDHWDHTARFGPAYRHRRRIVAGLVRGLPHDRIMDVGCGDGTLLQELSRTIPAEYSGVDISEHALVQARSRNPQGRFQVVNLEEAFTMENQDVVILSEVLEHLNHDEAALRHVARHARYVVVSVPGGPADEVDRRYGHVRNYPGDLLSRTLERTGFDVVYFRRWGWPFYDTVSLFAGGDVGRRATQGKYGPVRRLIAGSLYLLYFLNVLPRGGQVFAVGRSRARATP